MALDRVIGVRGDGCEGNGATALEGAYQPSDALGEGSRVSSEALVVDVDAVEVVLLDYRGEGGNGVGDPGIWVGGSEVDSAVRNGGTSEAHGDLDFGVARLDGGDLGGSEVVGVPVDVELAVGRGRGGVVVDGKGEDEVELDARVDWDVGEPDAIEQSSDVLSVQARWRVWRRQ